MNRCKTCKFYSPDGDDTYGECESPKFEYIDIGDMPEDDMLAYCDYEGYSANFEVGQNFGCIHHVKST